MGKEKEFPKQEVVKLIKVEQTGIVNFDEVYERIWAWFGANGWMCLEKNQTEKVLPDGKDLKIEWLAYRDPDDYVRFWMEAEVWILRCNDVLVVVKGKKVKKQKGDLEVRFRSFMEKDYRHKFRVTAFGKFLREIYEKYLIKRRMLKLEEKLRKETFSLQREAKRALQQLVTTEKY